LAIIGLMVIALFYPLSYDISSSSSSACDGTITTSEKSCNDGGGVPIRLIDVIIGNLNGK